MNYVEITDIVCILAILIKNNFLDKQYFETICNI